MLIDIEPARDTKTFKIERGLRGNFIVEEEFIISLGIWFPNKIS